MILSRVEFAFLCWPPQKAERHCPSVATERPRNMQIRTPHWQTGTLHLNWYTSSSQGYKTASSRRPTADVVMGEVDVPHFDRGRQVVQAGFDPNIFDAIDARVIIRRSFIIDNLKKMTIAALTAKVLLLTGSPKEKRLQWRKRVVSVRKVVKDRRPYSYTEDTWQLFRASDAAKPLKLKTGPKTKMYRTPKASSMDIEDAPVKPAELAVDVRKNPEARQAQMQLAAATGMVASLQKQLDKAKEELGEGQKREMAIQKMSTQKSAQLDRRASNRSGGTTKLIMEQKQQLQQLDGLQSALLVESNTSEMTERRLTNEVARKEKQLQKQKDRTAAEVLDRLAAEARAKELQRENVGLEKENRKKEREVLLLTGQAGRSAGRSTGRVSVHMDEQRRMNAGWEKQLALARTRFEHQHSEMGAQRNEHQHSSVMHIKHNPLAATCSVCLYACAVKRDCA